MKVNVNLNAVPDLEAVKEGWYPVRVEKLDQATSKSSGEPMLVCEATITDGEAIGRKLFVNLSLQEKALWKLKAFAKACEASWTDDGFDTEELVGAECKFQVEVEMYENKLRNRVTDFAKLS